MASPLSIFARKKRAGRKISMISLYDAPSARIACDGGVDSLLVGDSMGNVILGHDSTIPVTMEAMVHHTEAVVRGVKSSSRPDVAIVADLPFGTYATEADAVRNSVALMQAGAHGVKFEMPPRSDSEHAGQLIAALQRNGIPVMGHIGFTPQSTLMFDKVVQGRTWEEAEHGTDGLEVLAGCFAVVLEAMTVELAERIGRRLKVPTIGIGAGAGCDGQVLVWQDLVGLTEKPPKFVKQYAATNQIWLQAAQAFVSEVEDGRFPGEAQTYRMSPEERERWAEAQQREKDEMGIRLSNLGWGDDDETAPLASNEATLSEDAEEISREDEGRLTDLEGFWRNR